MDLPKVYIKRGREKALSNRHLWIFSGSLEHLPEIPPGEIVEIRLHNGDLAGYGFWIDGPSIKIKVFEYTKTEIDITSSQYWKNKIFKAYKLRENLKGITNGYRLIYAEGDFLPGLIIDVYDKIAVIQTYHSGIDRIFNFITQALKELGFNHIFLKKAPHDSTLTTGWLTEPYSTRPVIVEYGIKFLVDIEKGQKTGFYLDQRDNRHLILRYARGKNVLNLFSYTGGFSLYALKAGAERVVSVDMSARSLEIAEENIRLNNLDASRHEIYAQDCFKFIDNSDKNTFDLIVVDPPAFAKSKENIPNASRGYKEINKKVMSKIRSGGIIFTFSCSQRIDPALFRKIIFSAAAEAGRNIRIIHQLTQGIDHPINIFHPETEYLKGLVLYVE